MSRFFKKEDENESKDKIYRRLFCVPGVLCPVRVQWGTIQ
jgi:hypothetical protein